MTTPIYELGDLVTIRKGKKAVELSEGPSEDFLRYIQIEDLRNNDSMKYARNPKGPICDENDVLIAWDGAKAGTVGFGLSGLVGSTIAILRPNESVYAPYLGMMLKSKYQMIRDACTGATIPHVSKPFLLRMKIPLPSIQEQKTIADILSLVNEIKKSSVQMRDLENTIAKSIFLQMFGDPIRNPFDWEMITIGETDSLVQIGPFGSLLHKSDYVCDGIPIVNPKHIINGKIKVCEEEKISDLKSDELSKYHLELGDIVMGRRGEMGRCAMVSNETHGFLCGTGSLFIRPNPEHLNSQFLCHLISSETMKKHLERIAWGATMPNLNSEKIISLKIAMPPIILQNKFAAIIDSLTMLFESVAQKCDSTVVLSASIEQLVM